jgi:hypothetical protein
MHWISIYNNLLSLQQPNLANHNTSTLQNQTQQDDEELYFKWKFAISFL